MEKALEYTRIVCLVMYCVIFIVGILGNGLVIYVTGFRMKRTVNSVWFLNLALADFLFLSFLIFTFISVYKSDWPFGSVMCKLNAIVTSVNMFASIFLLTSISLDRCLSTWVVVWAQNKRTVAKAQLISAVVWGIALICSIPFGTFRDLQTTRNKTYCAHSMTEKQKYILTTFRFVVGFFIPFLVILVCYMAIAVRARRIQRTRKPSRIIFSIIFAFFICWLPYHVFNFIELKSIKKRDLQVIAHIGLLLTASLAFMNSCLNPILYVFMCEEFQKKLKQSICHVLESALAEDHLSFMSCRSLSSHLSRISRKSESAAPLERKDTCTSLAEYKVEITEERPTASTE